MDNIITVKIADKEMYAEITSFTNEYEYAYCVRVSDKLQQLIPVEHFSEC